MRTLLCAFLSIAFVCGCSKLHPQASATGGQTGQTSGAKPTGQAKAPVDPTAQEKAKFIGTWTAVDGEFQGQRSNPATLKDMKWVFTADKVSYSLFGKPMEATYSVQPNANPKTFDFKGPETAIQGIYELKGDNLRVCYAATERPTAFSTAGTSQDTLLFVFHRAK